MGLDSQVKRENAITAEISLRSESRTSGLQRWGPLKRVRKPHIKGGGQSSVRLRLITQIKLFPGKAFAGFIVEKKRKVPPLRRGGNSGSKRRRNDLFLHGGTSYILAAAHIFVGAPSRWKKGNGGHLPSKGSYNR